MNTTLGIVISPINVEERQKLVLKAGDTVRIWQKVKEKVTEKDKTKERMRLQAFEGLILACKHGKEAGATFTVRKVIDGIGVEKIFPLYSPMIDKIEVLKRTKVRRAKLYHIREKAAKEIKKQMKNMAMNKDELSETQSETEVSAKAKQEVKPEAVA